MDLRVQDLGIQQDTWSKALHWADKQRGSVCLVTSKSTSSPIISLECVVGGVPLSNISAWQSHDLNVKKKYVTIRNYIYHKKDSLSAQKLYDQSQVILCFSFKMYILKYRNKKKEEEEEEGKLRVEEPSLPCAWWPKPSTPSHFANLCTCECLYIGNDRQQQHHCSICAYPPFLQSTRSLWAQSKADWAITYMWTLEKAETLIETRSQL